MRVLLASVSALMLSTGAAQAVSFDLQGLLLATGPSINVTGDDGSTVANVTAQDRDGGGNVHVSFNLGIGSVCVPNPPPGRPSCSTEMNGGDKLTFSFAQPTDVTSLTFTNWGTGLGGDSATVMGGGTTKNLVGAGDIFTAGSVNEFSLGLEAVSSFMLTSTNSFGGFYVGGMNTSVPAGGGGGNMGGGGSTGGGGGSTGGGGSAGGGGGGVTPIPVPASGLLMLPVLAGLGLMRRKRGGAKA